VVRGLPGASPTFQNCFLCLLVQFGRSFLCWGSGLLCFSCLGVRSASNSIETTFVSRSESNRLKPHRSIAWINRVTLPSSNPAFRWRSQTRCSKRATRPIRPYFPQTTSAARFSVSWGRRTLSFWSQISHSSSSGVPPVRSLGGRL
jgi:hypothetical protein